MGPELSFGIAPNACGDVKLAVGDVPVEEELVVDDTPTLLAEPLMSPGKAPKAFRLPAPPLPWLSHEEKCLQRVRGYRTTAFDIVTADEAAERFRNWDRSPKGSRDHLPTAWVGRSENPVIINVRALVRASLEENSVRFPLFQQSRERVDWGVRRTMEWEELRMEWGIEMTLYEILTSTGRSVNMYMALAAYPARAQLLVQRWMTARCRSTATIRKRVKTQMICCPLCKGDFSILDVRVKKSEGVKGNESSVN